jgi:hypothetical protein
MSLTARRPLCILRQVLIVALSGGADIPRAIQPAARELAQARMPLVLANSAAGGTGVAHAAVAAFGEVLTNHNTHPRTDFNLVRSGVAAVLGASRRRTSDPAPSYGVHAVV